MRTGSLVRLQRTLHLIDADNLLVEAAEWAASTRRYDRVVIGSGDGIFVAAFDVLAAAGVSVEVVSRRQALAASLRRRARGCVRALRADHPST
jgi:uncharacterized LabA/DUF88 family protein